MATPEPADLIRRSNGYKIAFTGIVVLIAAVLLAAIMIVAVLATSKHFLLLIPFMLGLCGVVLTWVGVLMIPRTAGDAKLRIVAPSYVRTINRYFGEDIRSFLHFRRPNKRP